MQRPCLKTVAATLAVAALFVSASARAESPFVGNWKLLDVSTGHEAALVLFQIAEKDGKYQVKALASPLLENSASIENLKVDAKTMEFDVKFEGGTFHVKGFADAKTKGVVGAIMQNNRVFLAQFNKTDDTKLTRQDAESETAEGQALGKALETTDAKEKQAALKAVVEKYANKPAAYVAAQALLRSYVTGGAKDEELRDTAEKLVKTAARFGPDVEKYAVANACQTLTRGEKVSPVAVEFARKAEKELTGGDSASHSLKVLKALETALKKTGKENEAKELEPRIAKFDERLDVEFEKTAMPFKPGEYKGRKGESKRVAVVELFTGAYCPPCVAADVAFDAALETYKSKDVLFLQYHVHIPLPDRLTNPDTDKRMTFYGVDQRGVPTTFLNGKILQRSLKIRGREIMAGLGGPKDGGQESYNFLRSQIDEALETNATAAVKVNVERKGDKIDITGDVTELKNPGANVKLRFVLIQEVVRYPGGNGQRLHHHVVRALPGGADGFALKEATATQKVVVNLAELKKSLDEYLIDFNKGERKFQDDEHPLDMKNLKVIALVQDDTSKEILQAAQVDVPEAK